MIGVDFTLKGGNMFFYIPFGMINVSCFGGVTTNQRSHLSHPDKDTKFD